MKISDFKYSSWAILKDESAVIVLSNQHDDMENRLADTQQEKMLINAEQLVKGETAKHGVPHVAFVFPDSQRSRRAMFISPLTKHPEEMEFADPNSIPPYEEIAMIQRTNF